jgi:uncharacterized protein (DUF1800 family)
VKGELLSAQAGLEAAQFELGGVERDLRELKADCDRLLADHTARLAVCDSLAADLEVQRARMESIARRVAARVTRN